MKFLPEDGPENGMEIESTRASPLVNLPSKVILPDLHHQLGMPYLIHLLQEETHHTTQPLVENSIQPESTPGQITIMINHGEERV